MINVTQFDDGSGTLKPYKPYEEIACGQNLDWRNEKNIMYVCPECAALEEE